jgi:hypothetical protein
VPEEIILHRVIALEWELRKFDARVEEEGFDGLSGHVLRARLAAENRLRLDYKALGMEKRKPLEPSLRENMAGFYAAEPQGK